MKGIDTLTSCWQSSGISLRRTYCPLLSSVMWLIQMYKCMLHKWGGNWAVWVKLVLDILHLIALVFLGRVELVLNEQKSLFLKGMWQELPCYV